MVLILGIRHGFDLDHLATIDAITRTTKERKYLSRFSGILFSLGHGIIVIVISLLIGGKLLQAAVPSWLDTFGQWVSLFFLIAFGLMTLGMLSSSRQFSHISITPKSLFFNKLISKAKNPLSIVLIGSLFAFSFDTFTQVTLFSLSATVISGFWASGFLGIIFMTGMMLSDGLNGFVVSLMIQQADKKSQCIATILGWIIAGFSLILGFVALVKQLGM